MNEHRCFGCGRQISDEQGHIHVGLDDWGQRRGMEPIGAGIDDVLRLAFCEDCTDPTEDGWSLERHEI
jgi:hypothetical protein